MSSNAFDSRLQLLEDQKRTSQQFECDCQSCYACKQQNSLIESDVTLNLNNKIISAQESYNQIQIPPNKMSNESLQSELNNTRRKKCQFHQKSLKYFCKQEKEIICQECIISNHQGHDCQSMQQRISELNDKILLEIQSLELEMQLKLKIQSYQKLQYKLQQQNEKIRIETTRIQHFVQNLIIEVCSQEIKSKAAEIENAQIQIASKLNELQEVSKMFCNLKQKKNEIYDQCNLTLTDIQSMKELGQRIQKDFHQNLNLYQNCNIFEGIKEKVRDQLMLSEIFNSKKDIKNKTKELQIINQQQKIIEEQAARCADLEQLKNQNRKLEQEIFDMNSKYKQLSIKQQEMQLQNQSLQQMCSQSQKEIKDLKQQNNKLVE